MTVRPRILIATPYVAERTALADWLTAEGFEPITVLSVQAAVAAIEAGQFEILLSDAEFAFRDGLNAMRRVAGRPRQPTVMIGPPDATVEARAQQIRAIYLTRPVEKASLLCLVSMALVEGRPVRRSPRKMVQRIDATVDGVPSKVLDVSVEGLRLEVPRDCRSLTVPYFRVQVPMIGTTLVVQRVWTGIRPGTTRAGLALCGGSVTQNPPKARQAWMSLVEVMPDTAPKMTRPLH
jgi:CheY-like chemotaxis protein